MTPGHALRALLHGERCIQPASVYDPLSARAAAELGFEVAFLAGSVASLAVLGDPDLNLLTLCELAGLARRICRAGSPPLLIDADHGYGNALNVRRTVAELADAGAAGMTPEDTLLPAAFGSGPAMVSLDEAAAKLKAAAEAAAPSGFVVVARSSAYLQQGLDAACERVRAYVRTGADAVFVPGLQTRADLRAVAEAAGGLPLMAYAMGGEVGPDADLAPLGVRLLLVGHQPFALSVQAARDQLARQRGALDRPDDPGDLLKRLSREAEFQALARQYLAKDKP